MTHTGRSRVKIQKSKYPELPPMKFPIDWWNKTKQKFLAVRNRTSSHGRSLNECEPLRWYVTIPKITDQKLGNIMTTVAFSEFSRYKNKVASLPKNCSGTLKNRLRHTSVPRHTTLPTTVLHQFRDMLVISQRWVSVSSQQSTTDEKWDWQQHRKKVTRQASKKSSKQHQTEAEAYTEEDRLHL